MFKKAILFLGSALCLGVANAQTAAQPCGTDQHHKQQVSLFPQISATQAQLEQDIKASMQRYVEQMFNERRNIAGKGTAVGDWAKIIGYNPDTTVYHIPVVVHIIHNYGSEYISDEKVYQMITDMNEYYLTLNSDISQVIAPFKPYIGKANIVFHLATKDPSGQPTTGVTRRYTWQTAGGDELAKFDQWPTDRYLNIWSELRIGRPIRSGIVAAYSRFPSDGFVNPFGDGIISNSLFIGDGGSTIAHEAGHFLNLLHVWNSNDSGACEAKVTCGDDAVDDTPPTRGHFSGECPGHGCDLFERTCDTPYKKNYTLNGNSVTIDFPDTVNTQNIMDYSDCTNMFTMGQVARMRATLESISTNRYKLISKSTLYATGIWDTVNNTAIARPSLAPVADFSVPRNFICVGSSLPITNRSWRNTLTGVNWSFGSTSTPATSTNLGQTLPVNVTFKQTGWANVELTANSSAGSNTITRSDLIYVADTVATSPINYYQEFTAGGDVNKYPIFNYYKFNDYRWEVVNNVGLYDQSCIMYHNYDPRPFGSFNNAIQSPGGNFSDFFTPAFDLTGSTFAANCNLTFFSAGAFRTTHTDLMNDSLVISYSTDCGITWRRVSALTKGALGSNNVNVPFVPVMPQQWKLQGMAIPALAKSSKTYFRFRFYTGSDNGDNAGGYPWGTGNNFYLDRIHISNNSLSRLEVNNPMLTANGMTLAPNPTNGSAVLTIKGGDNSVAQINVTDITGKVVYRTEARLDNTITQVEIPGSYISVKGIYMVHVVSNGTARTQKLVVY